MRINRSNPEPSGAQRPAVQPQTAAPQQPAPRREEPRQEPPKPKKEKPKKRPEPEEYEAYEEDEEEKPRRRFPVGCLIVLVILALVGFGGYKVSQFYAELDGQGTLGEVQTITVPEGSSVSSIATQLKDSGVIQYDWLFKQYVKYSGKAGEIQYGSFEVQSGMAYNEIIKALSVVTRRPTVNVTIPEGTTAVGVAQIFVDAGLVEDVDTFLSCANGTDGSDWSQYDFWNAIPDNGRLMKCEGYLFPDTYNLYADESVYYYVNQLYGEFDAKTADLADTIAAKGTSLDDVVKLARIPRSAPASTTVLNRLTRSGRSTSWNLTPRAILCRTVRTTISGIPRLPSISAGRSRELSRRMCWLSMTPTPSAACPQAPFPARAMPPSRQR